MKKKEEDIKERNKNIKIFLRMLQSEEIKKRRIGRPRKRWIKTVLRMLQSGEIKIKKKRTTKKVIDKKLSYECYKVSR